MQLFSYTHCFPSYVTVKKYIKVLRPEENWCLNCCLIRLTKQMMRVGVATRVYCAHTWKHIRYLLTSQFRSVDSVFSPPLLQHINYCHIHWLICFAVPPNQRKKGSHCNSGGSKSSISRSRREMSEIAKKHHLSFQPSHSLTHFTHPHCLFLLLRHEERVLYHSSRVCGSQGRE